MSMNVGKREVDRNEEPVLSCCRGYGNVACDSYATESYVIDDPGLNAFATGSNPQNVAVAATSAFRDQ